jgi:peptide-methionine (S)-S-oxide reductase
VGSQYRSAVFYHNEEQRKTALRIIDEIEGAGIWSNPIVTEITPFSDFYPAEDYHQNYFYNNPNQGYCRVIIAPKVAKFRAKYAERLKR